jgi:hypothetical protein
MRSFVTVLESCRAGIHCLLALLSVSVLADSVNAATQGQWGKSSTATAKITLIIPERSAKDETAIRQHRNGLEALSYYCEHQDQRQHLYQFSLTADSHFHTVETALSNYCGSVTTTSPIVSEGSEITTIVVAPL